MSAFYRKRSLTGYLFISPWLIGLACFTLFPLLYSFGLSFTDWNILEPAKFVGLDNFDKLAHDPNVRDSLKVTAIYVVCSVPLGTVLSILLAVLLNQNVKGMRIFRTLFYLPSVVSGVAVSMLWIWIFESNYGLLNTVLSWFGVKGPHWLTDSSTALLSIIIMSLWGVGGSMVIYLAGLQSVPRSLQEAAELDGASRVRRFWSVTVPMLSPTVFFNLIMGLIGSFQVFTQALVMTGGGPGNATLFYVLYLYQNAFQFFKMGYASALGWLLFVIILVLILVLFQTSNRWVYYEGEGPATSRSKRRTRRPCSEGGEGRAPHSHTR
ncbi:carbohydrate ABC transporter permease [Cohnella zeiphila]|uniref:Sugar ABC transporter permease n=1 Tax=Cohnella zeiphila TaxID=2761120 RepID=A0A7X0VYA0_9BACL|nr:sugar ABC transporter permease [Cohnella zeiphila]MBB6732728.1 sugar ABC transporter permease [Cohnella zeiphila]